MSVSVDGFVAGPKGESAWIFRTVSDDAAKWAIDTHWNASLHLMGQPNVSGYGGVVADREEQIRTSLIFEIPGSELTQSFRRV
jgi:hypothetical protein